MALADTTLPTSSITYVRGGWRDHARQLEYRRPALNQSSGCSPFRAKAYCNENRRPILEIQARQRSARSHFPVGGEIQAGDPGNSICRRSNEDVACRGRKAPLALA